MDDSRFDSLTKALVRYSDTRRGVVRGAAASITGGVLGTLGLVDVAAKKKKKKCKPGTKPCGKKKKKCCSTTCPVNARFCAPSHGPCNAAGTCGCGSDNEGATFCADCAHCIIPECETDTDCTDRGLPAGTVCGDGTGGFCQPCTKVCLTPCGSCTDCSCQPN